MPPSAHEAMIDMMKRVYDALDSCKAGEGVTPLDLSWLYVSGPSVDPLLAEFKWWLTKGSTSIPISDILQKR